MPESTFPPGEPDRQDYRNYWSDPIPDPRDAVLDRYLAKLRAGGPAAVAAATDEATEDDRAVLQCYGQRAAARAVRERSVDLIVSGLVAVVPGGLHREREAFFPLALLDDAIVRIGADRRAVFDTAAAIVGNPGDINLMLWFTRRPEDRSLDSMSFAAADGPDGFRYVYLPPS